MKQETLEKAKQLEKEITRLETHYETFISATIKADTDKPYLSLTYEIYRPDGYHTARSIMHKEFFPVEEESFLRLYLMKVQNKIAELKKELENL